MPLAVSGHIFVSYSRRDDATMRKIAFFLRDQGFKVWVDNEKLIPGTAAWEEAIENAIKNAYAMIVILSPDSKNSEWVRREITYADQFRKRVFPVLVKGDDNASLPIRLITRQYVDFRRDENEGLNALSAAITFYIEEKQTLEMKRPSLGQEIISPSASQPQPPASPHQARSSKNWMLPAGIFLAICILGMGAAWIGFRIISPPRIATQPDTILPTPTTTPIDTPSQILANTSTPDPSIATAPDNPLDYLKDVQIVEVDTFDNPPADKWNIANGNSMDGVLEIIGNENWDGISRKRGFGEGEGIVIDFNYSKGAVFELFMDRGEYDTDTYRRFGVYIDNDLPGLNIWVGREYHPGEFSGDLTLEPDTNYSILIAVLPNAEFLEVIWNPSDPAQSFSYREKMDQTWTDVNWTFFVQAGGGTTRFDNFKEITFSSAQ